MPQFLLVFAVSFTPETPNFGTFGGVAHPPWEFFLIFQKAFAFYVCICTYLKKSHEKKLILKKRFQGAELP